MPVNVQLRQNGHSKNIRSISMISGGEVEDSSGLLQLRHVGLERPTRPRAHRPNTIICLEGDDLQHGPVSTDDLYAKAEAAKDGQHSSSSSDDNEDEGMPNRSRSVVQNGVALPMVNGKPQLRSLKSTPVSQTAVSDTQNLAKTKQSHSVDEKHKFGWGSEAKRAGRSNSSSSSDSGKGSKLSSNIFPINLKPTSRNQKDAANEKDRSPERKCETTPMYSRLVLKPVKTPQQNTVPAPSAAPGNVDDNKSSSDEGVVNGVIPRGMVANNPFFLADGKKFESRQPSRQIETTYQALLNKQPESKGDDKPHDTSSEQAKTSPPTTTGRQVLAFASTQSSSVEKISTTRSHSKDTSSSSDSSSDDSSSDDSSSDDDSDSSSEDSSSTSSSDSEKKAAVGEKPKKHPNDPNKGIASSSKQPVVDVKLDSKPLQTDTKGENQKPQSKVLYAFVPPPPPREQEKEMIKRSDSSSSSSSSSSSFSSTSSSHSEPKPSSKSLPFLKIQSSPQIHISRNSSSSDEKLATASSDNLLMADVPSTSFNVVRGKLSARRQSTPSDSSLHERNKSPSKSCSKDKPLDDPPNFDDNKNTVDRLLLADSPTDVMKREVSGKRQSRSLSSSSSSKSTNEHDASHLASNTGQLISNVNQAEGDGQQIEKTEIDLKQDQIEGEATYALPQRQKSDTTSSSSSNTSAKSPRFTSFSNAPGTNEEAIADALKTDGYDVDGDPSKRMPQRPKMGPKRLIKQHTIEVSGQVCESSNELETPLPTRAHSQTIYPLQAGPEEQSGQTPKNETAPSPKKKWYDRLKEKIHKPHHSGLLTRRKTHSDTSDGTARPSDQENSSPHRHFFSAALSKLRRPKKHAPKETTRKSHHEQPAPKLPELEAPPPPPPIQEPESPHDERQTDADGEGSINGEYCEPIQGPQRSRENSSSSDTSRREPLAVRTST